MKPTAPLLALPCSGMKPSSPLRAMKGHFWGISTLQRCCRFQWGAQCGLQRCCRFQWGRAAWCAKVLAVSKPPSSRPVHEKVRPARPRVGVSAKKFALHAQNGRKTPFSGALGEYFRGSAAGRSAVGEYFRGRAAEGPHSERVYVRPQSLRRPLVNRGTNFACNSLQGISNVELRSLKFCRFWLLADASSARIACDFWRAGEVCSDHWPHGGL